MTVRVLTVPGYTNSGPEHWQTRWEVRDPGLTRVLQRDWDQPDRHEWVDTLHRVIHQARDPVVLVAHSLGCAAVAHWVATARDTGPVLGALMVAPADVDQPGWPEAVTGFQPMPLIRLPLESTVVASRDDPWLTFARASVFAHAWGSLLVDAGDVGHLNSESRLGEWPAGWRLLEDLLARCGYPRNASGESTDTN